MNYLANFLTFMTKYPKFESLKKLISGEMGPFWFSGKLFGNQSAAKVSPAQISEFTLDHLWLRDHLSLTNRISIRKPLLDARTSTLITDLFPHSFPPLSSSFPQTLSPSNFIANEFVIFLKTSFYSLKYIYVYVSPINHLLPHLLTHRLPPDIRYP